MTKTKDEKKGPHGRKLRVTLVRSVIGYPPRQHKTVAGLGLHKLHSQAVHEDRPEIRGMIRKVSHLVKVEVVEK